LTSGYCLYWFSLRVLANINNNRCFFKKEYIYRTIIGYGVKSTSGVLGNVFLKRFRPSDNFDGESQTEEIIKKHLIRTLHGWQVADFYRVFLIISKK
jgi:hypothetical protein